MDPQPQFTLRTMLVSTTLFMVGFGCLRLLVVWNPKEGGGGVWFVVLYLIACSSLGAAVGVLFRRRFP
jgi:hypothetical protein